MSKTGYFLGRLNEKTNLHNYHIVCDLASALVFIYMKL